MGLKLKDINIKWNTFFSRHILRRLPKLPTYLRKTVEDDRVHYGIIATHPVVHRFSPVGPIVLGLKLHTTALDTKPESHKITQRIYIYYVYRSRRTSTVIQNLPTVCTTAYAVFLGQTITCQPPYPMLIWCAIFYKLAFFIVSDLIVIILLSFHEISIISFLTNLIVLLT